MKAYQLNDRVVNYEIYTGEVVDSSKREKVDVSGYGGQTNVAGGINPVHISSTSSTLHEFWLKDAEGVEHPFRLSGSDTLMRPGQRVSVVVGNKPNSTYGKVVQVINHSSQSKSDVLNKWAFINEFDLVPGTFSGKNAWIGLGLALIIGFIFFILSGFEWSYFFGVAMFVSPVTILFTFLIFVLPTRIKSAKEAKEHLNHLTNYIYKTEAA